MLDWLRHRRNTTFSNIRKSNKEIDHEFFAYAHAVSLEEMCHYRDRQGSDAASRYVNGTIKIDTLYKALLDETVCTAFYLTPKGYLKAIWTLFKITFIEKKFKSGIPIIGAIFLK